MNGEAAHEVPMACDWTALTAEQQERQWSLRRQLRADVLEVRELADGYAFRHSPEKPVLMALAEFVANERLCCPFFEFGLTVERGGGPVWFRMTGGEQAKRVLEAEMGQPLGRTSAARVEISRGPRRSGSYTYAITSPSSKSVAKAPPATDTRK